MTYFWYKDKAYIYDKLVRERERKKNPDSFNHTSLFTTAKR